MDNQELRQIIKEEFNLLLGTSKIIFQKNIQILDGRNIQTGKTTGTKIGTESTQKIGFFGDIPVSQQTAISNPSGGGTQDTESRTAIGSILTALRNLGLIDT